MIRPTDEDIIKAHGLHKAAFDNPKVAKLARNAPPLDEKMQEELFGEEGYRRGLARVNFSTYSSWRALMLRSATHISRRP